MLTNARQIALALVLSASLAFVGVTPANASPTQVTATVDTDNSLRGSTISGYDPNAILYLHVFTTSGLVNINQTDLVNVNYNSYGGTEKVSGLTLSGTQQALNDIFPKISVISSCDGGTANIYIEVNTDSRILNPLNGHIYEVVGTHGTWDQDKAAAESTQYPYNNSSTRGYLATITSALENTIATIVTQNSSIGASDAALEGDWLWATGPEAGTVFFRGTGSSGSSVDEGYNNWHAGEPNNWNGNEDYGSLYTSGDWNDAGGAGTYLVEYGGQPGDDLSGNAIQFDSATLSSTAVFAHGSGTVSDPYQVSTIDQLKGTGRCSGEGVYFKQTTDLTLPTDWSANIQLFGHYDGDNHSITFSSNTTVSNDFGVFKSVGNEQRPISAVHNLHLIGNLDATGHHRVGLLAGTIENANLNTISTAGSLTSGGYSSELGGVSGHLYGGTVTNLNSTVNISGSETDNTGGIFGVFSGTMNTSSWNGTINVSGSGGNNLGGIAGLADEANLTSVAALGTINVSGVNYVGGIAGNFNTGNVDTSQSQVNLTVLSSVFNGGLFGQSIYVYLTRSENFGNVTGHAYVGGLVGYSVYDTYNDVGNTGNVTGDEYVGLLSGRSVQSTYGKVVLLGALDGRGTGTAGYIGQQESTSLSKIFWNPESSGIPAPLQLSQGESPQNITTLKSVSFYNQEELDISANWSEGRNWTACDRVNSGFPFITAFYSDNPCADSQVLTPTPTISGGSTVGSLLTGAPGTWDSGTSLVYRWLRNGSAIPGQVGLTYRTGTDDLGQAITFEVTSTKNGFETVTMVSSSKSMSSAVATEIGFGGFLGNSWWLTRDVIKRLPSVVKAKRSEIQVRCIGVVRKFGSPAWQRTVGLARAHAVCALVKRFSPNVRTVYSYRVAGSSDRLQRGVAIVFSR